MSLANQTFFPESLCLVPPWLEMNLSCLSWSFSWHTHHLCVCLRPAEKFRCEIRKIKYWILGIFNWKGNCFPNSHRIGSTKGRSLKGSSYTHIYIAIIASAYHCFYIKIIRVDTQISCFLDYCAIWNEIKEKVRAISLILDEINLSLTKEKNLTSINKGWNGFIFLFDSIFFTLMVQHK